MFFLFVLHFFLLERKLFQPPGSKNVGADAFLVAKVQFFKGGETHSNMTISTMCKIST